MGLFSKDNSADARLLKAAEKGDTVAVKIALREGADVNAKTKRNLICSDLSALHYAAGNGHLEVMRILIDNGAKVDIKDSENITPLIYAAQYNQSLSIIELLGYGANINAVTYTGANALFHALYSCSANAAEELLEQGIDIALKRNDGTTVLEYIIRKESFYSADRAVKQFIEKKLAPNLKPIAPKPATEPKPKKNSTVEVWQKAGDNSIVFTGKYPELGYELTETFNLRSRQQIIVRKDLETKAINMSQPVSFNDIDKHVIQTAIDNFKTLGGKVNEDLVLHGQSLMKEKIKPNNP